MVPASGGTGAGGVGACGGLGDLGRGVGRYPAVMARLSPMLERWKEMGAVLSAYGPEGGAIEVPAAVGPLELEYAAVRKTSALLDQPHRGTVEVTGSDRLEFLNRMVTQELKGLSAFEWRPTFWLNRKGRIDADIRLVELPGRTLLEMDAHAVGRTMEGLGSYVITEDVTLKDTTEAWHGVAVHGPRALELLLETTSPGEGPGLEGLPQRGVCVRRASGGAEVVVLRDDETGSPGYGLLTRAEDAAAFAGLLLDAGADPEPGTPEALRRHTGTLGARVRLRAIGWHAFNVARIEAGRPLYNIDFGPDSLPAQSGVLHERVSFTKGCYLGQEVVARMHSRGHSKSLLVSVRVERVRIDDGPAASGEEESRPEQYVQPGTGAAVFALPAEGAEVGEPVGAVTSSCVSPLLGSAPICLAQVKQEAAKAGSAVLVEAEGRLLRGEVRERLSVLEGAK